MGLVLVIASTAAVAFQEQRVGAGGGASAPQPQSQRLDLDSGSQLPASRPPQGTEIRIPGLGRLGTLPKLDFGMELLYGTSDQRTTAPPSKSEDDGLAIRGSVKHKF